MGNKRYSGCRDSSVHWIGQIPEHWEIKKIKYLSPIKRGASPRPIDDPKYFDNNGEYSWVRIADVSSSVKYLTSTTQKMSKLGSSLSVKLSPGELFVSIAGTVGKPCITKINCCIHDGFVYFPDLKQELVEYLYYVFASGVPYKGLGKLGTQLNLNTQTVGEINVPIPSIEEVQNITLFLKSKIDELNLLIEKKQQLIQTLKKYRQSLITETVTKGLNPDLPMRDSGIEWLGEIPKQWDVAKLKHLALKQKGSMVDGPFGSDLKTDHYQETGVPIIQLNNLKDGLHINQYTKYTSEDKANNLKRSNIYPGDIVITKMMPVARAAIVNRDFEKYLISSDCIKFLVDENKVDKRFLVYFINSKPFRSNAESYSTGSTRLRTNLSLVKNFVIAYPSKKEQTNIADFLDEKTSDIDKTIAKVTEQIEALNYYKQSLIYETVTGKIDVRDYNRSLLEVEE